MDSVVIVEMVVEIAAKVIICLLGILASYLTAKLAEKQRLQSVNVAQQEVIAMAQQTVVELQQTVVDALKESNGGKLEEAQIKALKIQLVEKTIPKICDATLTILNAANVDLEALIHGAGEEWVKALKE